MKTHAHTLTALDEFKLWWTLHGELGMDVVTYYGICSAWGAIQGWFIGLQITRVLGS